MPFLTPRPLLVSLFVVAACRQAAPPGPAAQPPSAAPADAAAGTSGAGRVPGDSAPPLDPISLIGTWSFDRSCASDDGMTLAADGTAGTDQGSGMWAVDARHRLVLIVREREMGTEPDPRAERLVLMFTAARPVADDLVGRFDASRPGQAPREINAKRCPAS